MVACLISAIPPQQAGRAVLAAVWATRSPLRPGVAAVVLMWVFTLLSAHFAVLIGGTVLDPTSAADPPVEIAAAVL